MKTYLAPSDGRKSFYGKCYIIKNNKFIILTSYTTEVAQYDTENNKLIIRGYYSQTTARHINAFLQYIGREQMTKKEIENFKNEF